MTSNAWTTKLERVVRLQSEDRDLLERLSARSVAADPGRTLARQGDGYDQALLVLSGFVGKYKSLGDGRRQLLALLVPGDLCDLNCFILATLDYSLEAIGEATVALIPRGEFTALLCAPSALASALWWSELQAQAIQREWLVNLGRRNAYARTAHLLCELALRLRHAGVADPDGYAFPLTQGDLSDALGLSVVHVNRVLQRLREAELIVLRRGRLGLPDPARLAQTAGFDPAYLYADSPGGARLAPS